MMGPAYWLSLACLGAIALVSLLFYSTPGATLLRRVPSAIVGFVALVIAAVVVWFSNFRLSLPDLLPFTTGLLIAEGLVLAVTLWIGVELLRRHAFSAGALIFQTIGWLLAGLVLVLGLAMLIGAWMAGASTPRLSTGAGLIGLSCLFLLAGRGSATNFGYMLAAPAVSGLRDLARDNFQTNGQGPASVSFYLHRWLVMARQVQKVAICLFGTIFLLGMSAIALFDKGARDVSSYVGANKW